MVRRLRDPLVVASLGSTYQRQEKTFGAIIQALGMLPVRGFATSAPLNTCVTRAAQCHGPRVRSPRGGASARIRRGVPRRSWDGDESVRTWAAGRGDAVWARPERQWRPDLGGRSRPVAFAESEPHTHRLGLSAACSRSPGFREDAQAKASHHRARCERGPRRRRNGGIGRWCATASMSTGNFQRGGVYARDSDDVLA